MQNWRAVNQTVCWCKLPLRLVLHFLPHTIRRSPSPITDSVFQRWQKCCCFRFICTIVSIFVKTVFHSRIWCQYEMMVQCHCIWLLVPRKKKAMQRRPVLPCESDDVSHIQFVVERSRFHIWFCTITIFSVVWFLGTCRDNKWNHAKCLTYIYIFFIKAVESRRGGWGGVRSAEAGVWRSWLCCHRLSRAPRSPQQTHTHPYTETLNI